MSALKDIGYGLAALAIKPFHFAVKANVDHAREKRRLNSISREYSAFRQQFFKAGTKPGILSRPEFSMDKWVSLSDMMLIFHKAANVPTHVTPHDRDKYLRPLLNGLRNSIQNGEITGFYMDDAASLDSYFVRASRVWNAIMQADLPDGGFRHRAGSFHWVQDLPPEPAREVPNEEVPRLLRIDGEEHEEWLNIKLPLLFALATTPDTHKTPQADMATRYDIESGIVIKTESHNPYMP